MKLLIIAICLLIFVSCGSENNQNNEPQAEPKSMVEVEKFPEGKELFYTNCAACHHPLKDATGPALKGVTSRVPNKDWIYRFVKNPGQVIESKDAYAVALFEKWNKTVMTAFPNLTNEQIDEMLKYCEAQESKTVD